MGNIREWSGEKLVLGTKPSLSYMESGYSRFQRENREGRDREEGLSVPRKDRVGIEEVGCPLVLLCPPYAGHTRVVRVLGGHHVRDFAGFLGNKHGAILAVIYCKNKFNGLAQVFELGRHVMFPKTGKERVEVVYGVTSLRSERATPERLLTLVRGQGQIENKSHWVRDVTFDEDRSQVRCGNIPQVMAALRNTAIGLLRGAGYPNIAAACRQLAAQPLQALALIGIELEN